ncbi:MAG: squalene--hopene cyclase [Verrucomicrobia bacterium]|nr:squalene--hopene cyclase [Verrucomicrobiota bacterium]
MHQGSQETQGIVQRDHLHIAKFLRRPPVLQEPVGRSGLRRCFEMRTGTAGITEALASARQALLDRLEPDGFWHGHLSSSALATAVAVCALSQAGGNSSGQPVRKGISWLAANINADGGWGDTVDSPSNMATTLLAWSAMSLADPGIVEQVTATTRAEAWLRNRLGTLDAPTIFATLRKLYGDDMSFPVPILSTCALAGRLGPGEEAWRHIPQLPFELTLFPHAMFKTLRLSVVSYAIPALAAVGILRHRKKPETFPPLRWFRTFAEKHAVRLSEKMLPSSGGYHEAPPLTGFVVMCLAAAGYRDHVIVKRGSEFLMRTIREDGSWPVDLNLSVWLTSLSVKALSGAAPSQDCLSGVQKKRILNWLIPRQLQEVHPFTYAAPGGWPWTHLPGGVPDADDTSGALVALARLDRQDERARLAAARGITWLLDLQNADGGIPTFCRGWGKLPFDRSCPDLTVHALRAFSSWRSELDCRMQAKIDEGIEKGLRYLAATQRSDGSWLPLWFGSQWAPDLANPVYGTAQVLISLGEIAALQPGRVTEMERKGRACLVAAQNDDGGWGASKGARSGIEETAVAVEALCVPGCEDAVRRGADWLVEHTSGGTLFRSSPIGLYFAELWYSETLYPLIFTVSALQKAGLLLGRET